MKSKPWWGGNGMLKSRRRGLGRIWLWGSSSSLRDLVPPGYSSWAPISFLMLTAKKNLHLHFLNGWRVGDKSLRDLEVNDWHVNLIAKGTGLNQSLNLILIWIHQKWFPLIQLPIIKLKLPWPVILTTNQLHFKLSILDQQPWINDSQMASKFPVHYFIYHLCT